QFIRMPAAAIWQDRTITVNHGLYYLDLTARKTAQGNFGSARYILTGGETYDVPLLFGKPTVNPNHQMFVGTGLPTEPAVTPSRESSGTAPLVISADTKSGLRTAPTYSSTTGILTVTLNLSAYKDDFASAATALCQPRLFCQPTASGCGGKAGGLGNLTQA